MTDDRRPDDEERAALAAEYTLGLLTGEALARARALEASDGGFRREVALWLGRLAPLLDEIPEAVPPAGIWAATERRLGATAAKLPDNVALLRRRINVWRGYAAAATALAASFALVLILRPAPPPVALPQAAAMVATMGAEGSAAKLVATWDPDSRRLIVAAAAGMGSLPGKGYELWLIPGDGRPRPIGMIAASAPMRVAPPARLVAALREGAVLAVSIEPPGGSPTGLPTGPVIATGKLIRA
jgi:anti-sigma-K factor RskA